MSGRPALEVTDGVPMPQRIWAVLTIALAVILAVMDSAIANVALPEIARDLQTSPANSIWVVNAYQLSITICLLPAASLGEILGYQKVYRFGLIVFTLASLGCALSTNLPMLAVMRAVQGIGSAGILSINTAMIRTIYPRAMLGRGIGINAMVVAASSAAGPSVAAGILSVAHWPWLFAVNLPTGALALIIGAFALPHIPPAHRAFDWGSAGLNALAFGLLVTGIDALAHPTSWAVPVILLTLAVGFGAALVLRELSRPAPLLPVDLLRNPVFALAALSSACSFIGWALAYVSLPFFFQNSLGKSEVGTGLLMTPWPLGIMLVAPFSGRLSDRYPVGLLSTLGLGICSAGLAALAWLPPDPSDANIAWRMALAGIGFGLFQSPNNRAMVNAAPRSRSGGAAGMLSTARLLGQTTGAALVALVFTAAGENGTHATLVLSCGVTLFAMLVSSTRLLKAD
jgi:MFS transporter, DHA2 family, multidrug resistance protein